MAGHNHAEASASQSVNQSVSQSIVRSGEANEVNGRFYDVAEHLEILTGWDIHAKAGV